MKETIVKLVSVLTLKAIPFVMQMKKALAEIMNTMGALLPAPMKIMPAARANIARRVRQRVIAAWIQTPVNISFPAKANIFCPFSFPYFLPCQFVAGDKRGGSFIFSINNLFVGVYILHIKDKKTV